MRRLVMVVLAVGGHLARCASGWVSRAAPPRARAGLASARRRVGTEASKDDGDDWFLEEEHRRLVVPALDAGTWDRLEEAARCLLEWNAKINVVSRRDLDARALVEKHYLPSLALLNIPGLRARLDGGATVVDVGTGGGFPGLPLAIACPNASFVLADSVAKKLTVVAACAAAAGCSNARALHAKVPEGLNGTTFDFVLGRSVTSLPDFVAQVAPCLNQRKTGDGDASGFEGGMLYIKGGAFDDELEEIGLRPRGEWDIAKLVGGSLDSDKCVIHFTTADMDKMRKRPLRQVRQQKWTPR